MSLFIEKIKSWLPLLMLQALRHQQMRVGLHNQIFVSIGSPSIVGENTQQRPGALFVLNIIDMSLRADKS